MRCVASDQDKKEKNHYVRKVNMDSDQCKAQTGVQLISHRPELDKIEGNTRGSSTIRFQGLKI